MAFAFSCYLHWQRRAVLLMVVSVLGLAACSYTNPHYDSSKPHHTLSGFQNNYDQKRSSPWQSLSWLLTRQIAPLPKTPMATVEPQLQATVPNATWLGHSTVLLQVQGQSEVVRILLDPHFSERASPVQWAGPKRVLPPALALTALPHIDVVLISHDHYDHLDLKSVTTLAQQPGGSPLFLVPLGLKSWFADLGIKRVLELDWWQPHTNNGVEFVLVPAQHWSGRNLFQRNRNLWGGFVIMSRHARIVYTGDTGYSHDFTDIHQHFARYQKDGDAFDLAIIPIGCYEPRNFMRSKHLNPSDAVRVFQALHAKQALGVHWGTFYGLCDEPLDQAPKDLAKALDMAAIKPQHFLVTALGATITLPPQ